MSRSRPYKLGRYDLAAFMSFACYAGCSVIIPLSLVQLARDLDFALESGGMAAGGFLQGVRSVAMVIAMAGCGFAAGRFGMRKLMGAAMIFMGAGIALTAFSPNYLCLLPLLMLAGLGEGLIEGIATPFVQVLHPEESGRYVNTAHSFWSVGLFVFVLAGGALLGRQVSWRIVLGVTGLITLIPALLFLWREHPDKRYPEAKETTSAAVVWQRVIAIVRTPKFWCFFIVMFLNGGSEFCLTFWAASFIQLNFSASAWAGGIGTALLAAGMFCGRSGAGWLVKQSHLKHLLLWSALGTIPVALAILLIRPENFSTPAHALYALYPCLFLAGVGVAPFWPTTQVYCTDRLPHLDSTMIFVLLSCAGIPGCGFFSWLMGVVGDRYGLRASFWLVPATLAGIAAIILVEGFLLPSQKNAIQVSAKEPLATTTGESKD